MNEPNIISGQEPGNTQKSKTIKKKWIITGVVVPILVAILGWLKCSDGTKTVNTTINGGTVTNINITEPRQAPGYSKGTSVGSVEKTAGLIEKETGINPYLLKKNEAASSQLETTKQPSVTNEIEVKPITVDYSAFINTEDKSDMALVIVDKDRRPAMHVASEVAKLYRRKSYSISSGVFTYAFVNSKFIEEMASGDFSVLSKLNLPIGLQYIVVGKYHSRMEAGQYTRYICRAKLDIIVINVQQRRQVDAFSMIASNGYDDEEHAEAGVIEKLIDQYVVKSTSIKM